MEYRFLGRTGLNISPICFGTVNFGNPLVEKKCKNLVACALDEGINFFDTSNVYEGYGRWFGSSGGIGETILGKALSGKRNQVVICTKLGNPNGPGPLDAGLSARHLLLEIENSLRRLRTDWIDILLAHRMDPSIPVEDVWGVLDQLVRSGKVRCIGVSNWPSWLMAKSSELSVRYGWTRCSVSSPEYSLLNRQIELEHIPACLNYHVGLMTYKGLMGGILTGKYHRGQTDFTGTRAGKKKAWLTSMDSHLFDKLEILQKIASRSGLSMTEYAVAWLLRRPIISSVVLSFSNEKQLQAAVEASAKIIPNEDIEEIDQIFVPPKRPGGEQVMKWRSGWALDDREF